jgi:hypothetical protein
MCTEEMPADLLTKAMPTSGEVEKDDGVGEERSSWQSLLVVVMHLQLQMVTWPSLLLLLSVVFVHLQLQELLLFSVGCDGGW